MAVILRRGSPPLDNQPVSHRRGSLRRRWRRYWRSQLRPVWRVVWPVALAVLGAAVLGVGLSGYRTLGYTWSESLYGAVSQFIPGAFLLTLDGNNWKIEVTRAVAPVLTGYAVLQGLLALTRQHARLAWLRLAGRNHVVIAGLGTTGSVLAESLHEAGQQVVAVESDPENEEIGNARDSGVTVVVGSALDRAVMRSARVGKARMLAVTTGEDSRNLDALPVAAELLPRRRREPLTVLVQLTDRTLWHVLRAHAFWVEREPRLRVELFNLFELAARRLLEHFPPFGGTGVGDGAVAGGNTNVLVVGFDGVAPALVPEIARAWLYDESRGQGRLRITVVDPEAVRHCAWLHTQYPDLEEAAEIVPVELDPEGPGFQRGDVPLHLPPDYALRTTYVCYNQDVRAVAAAFALSQRPETARAAIVVTLVDPRSGVGGMLDSTRRSVPNLHTFSVLSGTLDVNLLRSGVNEQIAQANHAQYVRSQLALGNTREDNPTLVDWDELPESLKQSNRLFADGVGSKLAAAGAHLVPASLTPRHHFEFRPGELEELAKLEHDRWVADLRRQGWRRTDGEKDPERKRHPLLRPWEELSEEERDKDRVAVRELPDMLLRAGFEIYREEDAGGARAGAAAGAGARAGAGGGDGGVEHDAGARAT